MNLTGIAVYPHDLDGSQFWKLVRWCILRGATDFSVTTMGTNGYALAAQAKERLHAQLSEHLIGEQHRLVSMEYEWEEADALIWSLNESTLGVLEKAGIQVPKGVVRVDSARAEMEADAGNPDIQDSQGDGIRIQIATFCGEPTMGPESYEMYLCVYRDGIPMLAVFCEEYDELLLVLTDDDLESFHSLGLDAGLDLMPNYEF